MSQLFGWIWRWLVPERHSIYDRQLLALALSLMSVGLVIVASASITTVWPGNGCRPSLPPL